MYDMTNIERERTFFLPAEYVTYWTERSDGWGEGNQSILFRATYSCLRNFGDENEEADDVLR